MLNDAVGDASETGESGQSERLDLIIFLIKHGARFDDSTLIVCSHSSVAWHFLGSPQAATERGFFSVFLWLIHNGCPYNAEDIGGSALDARNLQAYTWAVRSLSLDVNVIEIMLLFPGGEWRNHRR